MSKIKFIISFVIIVIIALGVYAGVTIYKEVTPIGNDTKEIKEEGTATLDNEEKEKFVTTSTNTNFMDNPGYSYQDMQGSNELDYKKITTYEQYKEDLKKWSDLVEMTEEDFKENFVIVIVGQNYHTTGLEVENIATDETNLVIDLKQKDKYDETSVLTIKLSREYERENIILRNNPIKPVASNNMAKIEDIPAGYTIEQAIKDGCFVIKYNQVLSNDKTQIDEFVDNCNDKIDGFIRIYDYNIIENATIIDLQCKNGKISKCDKNVTQEGAQVGGYKSGYKINVREFEDSTDSKKNKMYELEDEIGNKRIICNIEI